MDNFIKVAQEEQQTEQFKAELLALEEQERQLQQEQEQRRQKFSGHQQPQQKSVIGEGMASGKAGEPHLSHSNA